jgi:putative nucleotidyltransferase with HDIG domain
MHLKQQQKLRSGNQDSAMMNAASVALDVTQLVTLPQVALRVCSLVEDPDATVEQIGRLVAQDPALTARLLTYANGAALGRSRGIDSVPRAVTMLGIRTVRDLCLGIAAAKAFARIPNELITMESFWNSSLLCAVSARLVAAHSPVSPGGDASFAAGLLHDIGQLAMFHQVPEGSRQALEMSIYEPGEPALYLCEREVLGFDHAQVGAELARSWGLPASLQECIAWHHEPQMSHDYALQVAVVHLANSIGVLAEIESDNLDDAPPVDAIAWSLTGLSPDQVPEIAARARAEAAELRSLFTA